MIYLGIPPKMVRPFGSIRDSSSSGVSSRSNSSSSANSSSGNSSSSSSNSASSNSGGCDDIMCMVCGGEGVHNDSNTIQYTDDNTINSSSDSNIDDDKIVSKISLSNVMQCVTCTRYCHSYCLPSIPIAKVRSS